ncbi:SMI1/KNR4 family protein [Pseudomonas gingeri]|uniref:SMI1/KNR4 family protein n=1 Tax=Pseudomonas gingeri TaxID=117681 RepID=UPI00159FA27D|nr:SMI1/KNR4 family protein [Pseudomonas gingeri]NWA27357.1 SMI1/KNR4 family protein [Pseudomonas gingeri]NWD69293.1 SMI1/KNR4 family protein [Pseudomonas gingeri]NWD76608.1 SMI1/KNR4 family protein [Pseudomonas gingeri]
MIENTFSNDEAAISPADLDNLESVIGKRLPIPFRDHYLRYNGGVPERTYWLGENFDEPLEVAAFKAIANVSSTLLSTYQSMLKKQVIPPHLLPFANDWGGNFFCLNLDSGAISYFTTDSFDSNLSPDENQVRAEKSVCSNFTRFVQGLIDEENLDED